MGWIANASRRVVPFNIPLKSSFPPQHLFTDKPLEDLTVEELEKRTKRLRKLEGLYHKGQVMAWDGKKVLADLVEKHGGVNLPPEKRQALASIFTIIMWGELAAWEVASFLAEHIRENTEAKMAATIQTFDEARHYYVLRDYLNLLDIGELPPPNSFIKSMLSQMLATDSIVYKLIGMQLFVEHIAVHLFRSLSELDVEPVLTDLLPYFVKDEARHVALGKLFLPELLTKLSRREALTLQAYQLWLVTFMQLSLDFHHEDADIIGIDLNDSLKRALRDQTEMIEEIQATKGVRGIVVVPKRLRFINRWLINALWSKPGENTEETTAVLGSTRLRAARTRFVNVAERVWGKVA
jgi:hypothetical protein